MWVILAVQGIVFLFWTIDAFRILFHLLGRARAQTEQVHHGPVMLVRMVRAWGADPAFRAQRWRFLGLTVALLGLSALFAAWQPAAL